MKQLDGTGMKRLHREWRRRTEGRLALVLDDVQGPFNVGAIIRTAAALRVDDVWLAGRTPEPDDAKVGKTALGTERYLTFHRVDDGRRRRSTPPGPPATGSSASSWPTTPSPLHELALGPATCLVVGHEDRGCSPATLAACDAVAYLPLLGKVGSLNVATAASIALLRGAPPGWADPPTG